MTLLYHFTAHHLVSNILNEGISKGIVIKADALGMLDFIPGFQWITKNKNFAQSWSDNNFTTLPYLRNEVRFTLSIPNKFDDNLLNWLKYCKNNPNEMYDILNMYGDPENWFLFQGTINPKWIKAIDFDPDYIKQRKIHEQSKNERIKNNTTRRNRGVLQID